MIKQIEKDTMCYYCFGCNRLEILEFDGVKRCKDFLAARKNWQEEMRKELQKNGK